MERAEQSLDTQEVERLLRSRLDEIQARIAELAKPPEPGSGIGFGKRIGDDRLHETEQWACGMLPLGPEHVWVPALAGVVGQPPSLCAVVMDWPASAAGLPELPPPSLPVPSVPVPSVRAPLPRDLGPHTDRPYAADASSVADLPTPPDVPTSAGGGGGSASSIAGRCAELQGRLAAEGVALDVVPAGEVDIRWALGASEEELRLVSYAQGGTDLLLETPYGSLPPTFEDDLFQLVLAGFRPLLAHPERSPTFQQDPERVVWWSRGCVTCSPQMPTGHKAGCTDLWTRRSTRRAGWRVTVRSGW